jgi:hypothetical protein
MIIVETQDANGIGLITVDTGKVETKNSKSGKALEPIFHVLPS